MQLICGTTLLPPESVREDVGVTAVRPDTPSDSWRRLNRSIWRAGSHRYTSITDFLRVLPEKRTAKKL